MILVIPLLSSGALVELRIASLNVILSNSNCMVENTFSCDACGASFSTHQGLVNHNVHSHGAAIGAQLRQSEEIQKQRAGE
jgi:hypothetical protein